MDIVFIAAELAGSYYFIKSAADLISMAAGAGGRSTAAGGVRKADAFAAMDSQAMDSQMRGFSVPSPMPMPAAPGMSAPGTLVHGTGAVPRKFKTTLG